MNDIFTRGVRLRPRLQAVMDMVTGESCADIGADHGRLSAALIESGRIRRVICTDISAPSLKKAQKLISLCSLNGVEFRLGDGLLMVSPGEADTIIFAGMGGTLIADILRRGEQTARSAKRLIFQPMRSSEDLRRYLCENGYRTEHERLVYDAKRYYQVISAVSGEPRTYAYWPDGLYSLGPDLYERRDPLLPAVVERYITGHEKRLARASGEGVTALCAELERLYAVRTLIKEGTK